LGRSVKNNGRAGLMVDGAKRRAALAKEASGRDCPREISRVR
jgi:hypothetical protein